MNDIIEINNIENIIYEVRGVQVILSSDVARLYQVETKRVNEVIKRNIKRFPETFCFRLINEEIQFICSRSQIATLNISNNLRGYNVKYLPYVLTEQGIMMLSGLLKSDIAVKVNIQIIDAFVKMRRYFANGLYNNDILKNHESRLLKLEKSFDKVKKKEEKDRIFFENKMYDAYSLFMNIIKSAKKEIILIDNYAGRELLDIIKDINTNIVIVSKNIDETLKSKYNSQYSNAKFIINDSFHDRFILLDRKKLYHSGSSFKDLGKKCFGIHKIEETMLIKDFINKLFGNE